MKKSIQYQIEVCKDILSGYIPDSIFSNLEMARKYAKGLNRKYYYLKIVKIETSDFENYCYGKVHKVKK